MHNNHSTLVKYLKISTSRLFTQNFTHIIETNHPNLSKQIYFLPSYKTHSFWLQHFNDQPAEKKMEMKWQFRIKVFSLLLLQQQYKSPHRCSFIISGFRRMWHRRKLSSSVVIALIFHILPTYLHLPTYYRYSFFTPPLSYTYERTYI